MKPKPSTRPGPLVRVEWVDIYENPEWADSWQPQGGLCHCVSVGWMTRKDKDMVVLVNSFGDDRDKHKPQRSSGGVLSIPRGCVTRIVRLEETK